MLICSARLKIHEVKDYLSFMHDLGSYQCRMVTILNESVCQNSSFFYSTAMTYLQSSLIQHKPFLSFLPQIYLFCLFSEHALFFFKREIEHGEEGQRKRTLSRFHTQCGADMGLDLTTLRS